MVTLPLKTRSAKMKQVSHTWGGAFIVLKLMGKANGLLEKKK